MSIKYFNLKGIYGITFSRKSSQTALIKGNLGKQTCQSLSSASNLSPHEVLSNSNRQKCLTLLNSSKPASIRATENIRKAAVLVPLCEVDKKLALLYTVRATHLKVNGGEVAFPGGMLDKSDESLQAAALRETHEEIGISPGEVDIWGKGPEIERKDVIVTPFLGYAGCLDVNKLDLNINEVSTAFAVSLECLSSPENFRVTRFRFGKNFIYKTPVYLQPEKRIWGLTAYITHIILSSLIPEYYKKRIKFHPGIQKMLVSK